MKPPTAHPEDFSPYLDGDVSDPAYPEIAAHLQACEACRRELDSWKAHDGYFRGAGMDLEVPPFQWQRIRAALVESQRAPSRPLWDRLFAGPRIPAWAAFAVVLLITAAGGLGYRDYARRQDLAAIARYAAADAAEQTAGNPFRLIAPAAAADNPFAPYHSYEGNPFAIR